MIDLKHAKRVLDEASAEPHVRVSIAWLGQVIAELEAGRAIERANNRIQMVIDELTDATS